ncbi:MAG: ankyrin repeat domain-containing protein [Bacteroidia bacterium]
MAGGDWKAMFRGIQENDLELVKYYLKTGIDPNYQHPEYLALPLAESIRYDHMEMTELLLKYGASSAIIEEESGISVLEIAKSMKKKKVVKLLEKYLEVKT